MRCAAALLACLLSGGLHAAEIRACGARVTSTILAEIGPEFEHMTGHRIAVTIDVAAAMARRFEAGEPCDLLVVIENQLDALVRSGKILASSRTVLARSGIGVEVRKGARKPDISTVDTFKRAVLDAKSVAYLKEGASGVYLAGLFDRLGIATAIEPRLTRPDTDIVSKLVAEGKIELGLVVITQILTTPGVELVGPLPPEIQSYLVFVAGVASSSTVKDPTQELLRFMTGQRAKGALRSQGMEPG